VIRPVGVLLVTSLALLLGGFAWSLWDLGGFLGMRYGLDGFAGLQVLDPVYVENSEVLPLEPGYGPWFQPTVSNWIAVTGFVLFVASIGLGAALWRPRPRVAREAATDEVTV